MSDDDAGEGVPRRSALKGGSSWRRTLRGYLLLPHAVPVLVVELATALFAIIAWGGVPPLAMMARLLLAMLGGQLAIGAANELADVVPDSLTKPWKPLPAGDVSMRGARVMVAAGLVVMAGLGATFGGEAFVLLLAGTGLGLAYDLWLKRTVWSWLPYLLALPLLPIWVFSALGRPEPRLLLLYPLGGLATIGVHFAQSLPDVAADRAAGLANATSRLGEGTALALAWLATLSAPLLAWPAAYWLGVGERAVAVAAAAVLALALLLVNLAIIGRNRRQGIAATFPLIALATVVSGLAWTWAVAG